MLKKGKKQAKKSEKNKGKSSFSSQAKKKGVRE
jgi:hypothetical protein